MALMGFREYARHRGCTLAAVQKAVESGRVTVCYDAKQNKRIDSISADATWKEKTDPAKQSLLYAAGPASDNPPPREVEPTGPGGAALAAPPADDGVDPEPEDETDGYRLSRAQREVIRVERDQIELDQLKGNLIALEAAKLVAFTSFRTLRDSLLNIPARIKDECATETDPFKVEALIEAELSAVLASFVPAVVPQDDDDADAD